MASFKKIVTASLAASLLTVGTVNGLPLRRDLDDLGNIMPSLDISSASTAGLAATKPSVAVSSDVPKPSTAFIANMLNDDTDDSIDDADDIATYNAIINAYNANNITYDAVIGAYANSDDDRIDDADDIATYNAILNAYNANNITYEAIVGAYANSNITYEAIVDDVVDDVDDTIYDAIVDDNSIYDAVSDDADDMHDD